MLMVYALIFFGGLAISALSVIFLIGYTKNRIKREAGDGVGCLMILSVLGVPAGLIAAASVVLVILEPLGKLKDIPFEIILPIAGFALGLLVVLPLFAAVFGLLCSAPFFIMAKITAKKSARQENEEYEEDE